MIYGQDPLIIRSGRHSASARRPSNEQPFLVDGGAGGAALTLLSQKLGQAARQ